MNIFLESCDPYIIFENKYIQLNKFYTIIEILDINTYVIKLNYENKDILRNYDYNLAHGTIRFMVPQLFNILHTKSKSFCDLFGIAYCSKFNINVNTRILNKSFDYFYMIIKPFQTFDINNVNIYSPFAKIQLGTNDCDNCKVLYNTFVDIPKIYYDPVKNISSLEISFVDPCGNPYNFGNLDHSFTLEFITIDDTPVKTLVNPNTMKSYGVNVFDKMN